MDRTGHEVLVVGVVDAPLLDDAGRQLADLAADRVTGAAVLVP